MLQKDLEKIPVQLFSTSGDGSAWVAREIAALIRTRQMEKKPCVIGLATGSTPTRVYAELIRMHKEGKLSFANVHTFNLDEYYPMTPESLQSYVRFMKENLFNHIDIPKKNIHIPDGTVPKEQVDAFCRSYEETIEKLGGIDLQILGIGRTGHIGFNEPGSPERSKTRLINLDQVTRIDAAADFFGEAHVPRKAITMGVGTIMKARRVILMAWGEGKADVIRKTVEGPITDLIPATFLQHHAAAQVILDEAAASKLTAVRTPWLVVQSEDDEVVDVAANRRFFEANAGDPRSLFVNYFSEPPKDVSSERVIWLPAADEALRVVGLSHLAVHIAPDNPHYGLSGSYRNCGSVPFRQPQEILACKQAERVWYGVSGQSPPPGEAGARATFNPHFADLEQRIGRFLDAVDHRRADKVASQRSQP